MEASMESAIEQTESEVSTASAGFDLDCLRAATESERRHLAFLSHDLNNNLSAITLHLAVLEVRLAKDPGFAEERSMLSLAQQAIRHTTDGMRRLLAHERLRRQGHLSLKVGPVNLNALTNQVATHFLSEARANGLELSVEVASGAVVESDRELIA